MDNETLAVKLQEATDRSIRNEERIEKLEHESDVLHSLATSVAVMAKQLENMTSSLNTLTTKVEDLEDKPGKRWDTLVGNVIWAIGAAVVAYVLAQVGL